MCGIVGFAGYDSRDLLRRMNTIQAHRGPDDAGELWDDAAQVGLAMRRLAIVDLSGGAQPMSNETGDVWIIYNGEVYNAEELRARIEPRHTFQTDHSDTEVLIHLYEEMGADMLTALNGMFAFVIYDQRNGTIFAARDHTGIKPFYYTLNNGQFAFASELKSLLVLPGFERRLNPDVLHHYVSLRYTVDPIWDGVNQLAPGEFLTFDLKTRQLDVKRYWSLTFDPESGVPTEEWAQRIRSELQAAATRWTISDVPVGCSLSGGLDSTAIVALLSEAGYDVNTYSLGFAGDADSVYDELPLARQVAERYGTQHHELRIEPDDLLDALIDMVWHLDEPYGGGLPSWYVFQFMREHVTVGLTGSGGDELFGNYGKYWLMERHGLNRAKGIVRQAQRWNRVGMNTALDAVGLLNDHPLRRYEHIYYDEPEKSGMLQFNDVKPTWELFAALPTQETNPRNLLMQTDFRYQLAHEFLFMTDRFSMAHSLEARTPFLDAQLIDLVRRIPADVRTRLDDPKYLLRMAVRDLLPDDVVKGNKRGFVLPIDHWLRGKLRPLVEQLLGRDYLTQQGLFTPQTYDLHVAPHLSGSVNSGERIWNLLMFQLWYVVYVEQGCTEKPTFTWEDLV